MTKRIFRYILLVTAVILLLSCVLISLVVHRDYEDQFLAEIRSEVYTITCALNEGLEAETLLPRLKQTGAVTMRITWIDAQGTVLYDSDAEAAAMENHLSREEIAEALEWGEGRSIRYSSTLGKSTFYYACRLSDGTVLRISGVRANVWGILLNVLFPMLLVFLVAILLCLLLAYRIAKRAVKPLNEVDLEHPEEAQTYEELSPLLEKIAAQNRQITAQMQELRHREEEFTAVTEHMSEGLLMVDPQGKLLLCNTTGEKLLGLEQARGKSLLEINRSPAFRAAAEAVSQGRREVQSLSLEGRSYQLMCTPAFDGEKLTGATLVLLDVTEKEDRERLRREFTANVSHELRTPLTAIGGYAELIAEGMAKAEDVPRFAAHVQREAKRLLALIEDILRLSQLDEGNGQGELCPQRLDLLAAAVREQLVPAAREKGVELSLEAEPCELMGVGRLLEELIFNLCDNAVKYNRPGGKVKISVGQVEGRPTVTVADTGIGIPAGEQERVFERFYRVDKSHSKTIGGTGLGLSIVKHAALYHKAQISLDSTLGQGTTVTVSFPKE